MPIPLMGNICEPSSKNRRNLWAGERQCTFLSRKTVKLEAASTNDMLMKTWKIIVLIGIAFLIVIQFFPTLDNTSDEVQDTDLVLSQVPPSQVGALLYIHCTYILTKIHYNL